MDIKKIFSRISSKLLSDFDTSSELEHTGVKGNIREDSLKGFLVEKLPHKYGLSSGQIISPFKSISKQTDIIIYNRHEFNPLFGEGTQIFPVESLYGIIEVKSSLTKDEFIKGLENIKALKELIPSSFVGINKQSGHTRLVSKPFGIIFAYSLGENSLESLVKNLKEWEAANIDKTLWPNLIVVLGQGIIYHQIQNSYRKALLNEDMQKNNVWVTYTKYNNDTLLYFYLSLLDLCDNTELGKLNLINYIDPWEKIGDLIVRNHDRLIRFNEVEQKLENVKLTKAFIEKVYRYCKNIPKITWEELTIQTMGFASQLEDSILKKQVYLYNPDNLVGMPHMLNIGPYVSAETKLLIPNWTIEINNEEYCIPNSYVSISDVELI